MFRSLRVVGRESVNVAGSFRPYPMRKRVSSPCAIAERSGTQSFHLPLEIDVKEGLFGRTITDAPAPQRAPTELNPGQMKSLEIWAEERVPWVTRGALDCLTPLPDYVDSCLSYFEGTKRMRPNWLGTVKNWIRRDERARLEAMARKGNESARIALRDPDAWRVSYDRVERQLATAKPPSELLIPKDPARSGSAVSLTRSGA